MRRGSIYWVDLEPSTPPEFGKIRPAVIVSNSEQNQILSTVVMIPFSSLGPEIWPLRLSMKWEPKKVSFLIIPGIRQVNKKRLKKQIGSISEDILFEVDEALMTYLSD